jgi:hypothetical protein
MLWMSAGGHLPDLALAQIQKKETSLKFSEFMTQVDAGGAGRDHRRLRHQRALHQQ